MRRWLLLDLRRWVVVGAVLALIFMLTVPSSETAGRSTRPWRGDVIYVPPGADLWNPPPQGWPAPEPAPGMDSPVGLTTMEIVIDDSYLSAPPQSRTWPTGLILLGVFLFAGAIVAATLLDRRRQRLTR